MIIVSTALDQFSLGIFTSHKSVYLWCTYTGTSMPALNNRSLSVRYRTDVVRANSDKSSKFFCSYVNKKIIFRQNSRIMYYLTCTLCTYILIIAYFDFSLGSTTLSLGITKLENLRAQITQSGCEVFKLWIECWSTDKHNVKDIIS